MRRWIYIGVGALAALVVAFLAGRYSAPVKVRTETKVETKTVTVTEWKDRIVERQVKGPVRVRVVTVEKPGGERVIEKWIERAPVTTETQTNVTGTAKAETESTSATSRVTEGARPGWAIAASGSWDPRALSSMPDRYGLELDRRVIGTVWLGVRADADDVKGSNLRLGVAARVEF